jgi:hypothetical protein
MGRIKCLSVNEEGNTQIVVAVVVVIIVVVVVVVMIVSWRNSP